MGTSKYCFGLFFENYLAAVVCYGPLISPTKYSKLLGHDYSNYILQLCRGASIYWAPNWVASHLISTSLKILKKTCDTKIVIAYADPDAGEIGIVYQASNAIYFGKTNPGGGKKYVINGKIYDPRKVHKLFGSRAHSHIITIDPNYSTIPIKPKYRYIFIIGSKTDRRIILKKIQPLIKDYPKRTK